MYKYYIGGFSRILRRNQTEDPTILLSPEPEHARVVAALALHVLKTGRWQDVPTKSEGSTYGHPWGVDITPTLSRYTDNPSFPYTIAGARKFLRKTYKP